MKITFENEGNKVFMAKDGQEKEELCTVSETLISPKLAAQEIATAMNALFSRQNSNS